MCFRYLRSRSSCSFASHVENENKDFENSRTEAFPTPLVYAINCRRGYTLSRRTRRSVVQLFLDDGFTRENGKVAISLLQLRTETMLIGQ